MYCLKICSFLAIFAVFSLLLQKVDASDTTDNAKNDSISAIFEIPEDVQIQIQRDFLAPKCDNFLENVLNGRWVEKENPYNYGTKNWRDARLEKERKKKELDEDMRSVWKEKGIPSDPFISTTLCGYYRLRRATSRRPSIGTWCDPDGPTPCCNNAMYGRCVPASESGCTCSKCVDVRKMKHAELMDWKPYDSSCKWMNYDARQSCEVLDTSPVKELYLVGDSFIQNMYISLLMIMSGTPIKGGWTKTPLTDEQLTLCDNYGLTYFIPCRAMIDSLDDMLYRDRLCGDGRNVSFKLEYKKYYSSKFGSDFEEFIRGLLGRPGTYVVVGIGFHVQMDLRRAVDGFMHPAVRLVNRYYQNSNVSQNERWPQFLFSHPLDHSILKPVRHLKFHSIERQHAFERGMNRYCARNSIPVLDFTPLTKNVMTFDGVHYGVGVNLAKAQILLNYFAALPTV